MAADFVTTSMKKGVLLLAELVEEDLGVEWALPWFFHVLEEEKHGGSQGLWTGQCYCQWTLKNEESK